MSWLFFFACAAAPEPPDGQRYAAALSAPPETAFAQCASIRSSEVRGDCQVANVARFLAAGGSIAAAEAHCASMTDAFWGAECWFQIVDSAALGLEDARRLCAASTVFSRPCLEHAMRRDAALIPSPVGQEPRLRTDLQQLVVHALPDVPTDRQRIIAEQLFTARIAGRWREMPFDPALCGILDEMTCMHAYQHSIQRQIGAVCGAKPATIERVRASGLSGWTVAGAALAEAVWAHVCAR
ncbi:MAG: hypothetical protein AAFV53_29310 [Myxococcota bacterium]